MNGARLSQAFRRILPEEDPRLDETLARIVSAAREAWPAIDVAADDFVAHLARHVAKEEEPFEALEEVRAGDLWLACACAGGDDAAISAFTKTYLDPIFPLPRDLARLSGDVKQLTSMKLLVGEGERGRRIAEYSGRGDLGSWTSVVALRIALSLLRSKKREVALDEERVFTRSAGEGHADAELAHLKKHYRVEFAEAFQAALATLTPRDRNVLRQHHVDGLTMEEIARIYRVHRITVVRWIESAREEIAAQTRKSMIARLRVPKAEVESILRMIRSQVDLSLRKYLPKSGP